MNNSFVFYASILETIEKLDAANQQELSNKLLRAVIEIGIYGEYSGNDPVVESYLPTISIGIKNATKRYESAVHGGAKGGRPTRYDKEEVLRLKASGMSNTQVAEQIGCSVKTVSRYWNEWTKPRHNQDKTGQNDISKPGQNQDITGQNQDIILNEDTTFVF